MYQYGTRRYSSSSHHQSPVGVGSQSRLSAAPSSVSGRSRLSPAPAVDSAENFTTRRLSHSNDSYSSSAGLASSSRRGSAVSYTNGTAAATGLDLRPTRYDSYYSRNNRYLSPSNNSSIAGNYLSGSRDSSFSSSWPSPVRKDYEPLLSAGYTTRSNYSSQPSVGGFSASVYRPSNSSRSATPLSSSRRNSLSYSNNHSGTNINAYSASNYLDTSTSRLGSSSRRYSGAGLTGGSSDLLARNSLSRPLSRSGSRTSSFSPMPQPAPLTPSSSGPRTSWSKHYSQISAQWAENTGSHLTNKSPYNYRPTVVSSRYEPNSATSRRYANLAKLPSSTKRHDSDGYDSSSSGGDDVICRKLSNATATSSGGGGSAKVKKRHKKSSKNLHNNANASASPIDPTSSSGVKVQITNHDDAKKSSSDEEPSSIHESVDARIKARRRRLQKSRNILQQQKEDSWTHRRALQIEECKQRTFDHLLSPMTEMERRQQERRGSKGAVPDPGGGLQPTEPMANGIRSPSEERLGVAGSPYVSRQGGSKDPSSSLEPCEQPRVKTVNGLRSPSGEMPYFNIDIKPFPSHPPANTNWSLNSVDVKKASVSPSKSPDPAFQYQLPELTKIASLDSLPDSTAISKRRDFNYNEYVSSIAPKKDHHHYDSPSQLLLETDQQLLKQALNSKDRNSYNNKPPPDATSPVLTLDYRKSVSPRSLDSFNVDLILAKPAKSGSVDIVPETPDPNIDEDDKSLSASISITLPLQLVPRDADVKQEATEAKPGFENQKNFIAATDEVEDEIFYFPLKLHDGKRLVISNVTEDNIVPIEHHQTMFSNNNFSGNPDALQDGAKKVAETESDLCNVSANISLTSFNNNNKAVEPLGNISGLIENGEAKIASGLIASDAGSNSSTIPPVGVGESSGVQQHPVAKPRKSLEQKQQSFKIKVGGLVSQESKSSPKASPSRDLSPKISAVILEEVKIDTAPLVNTIICEPTKKVQHSPQAAKLISVSNSDSQVYQASRKQPEIIEPTMSVVLFERQVKVRDQNGRKSKSPAKTVASKEKSPTATKLPVAQQQPKIITAKTSGKLLAPQSGPSVVKQKSPEQQLPKAPSIVTQQKQKTPERKLPATVTETKNGVKKQKTPERQQLKPEPKAPLVNGHKTKPGPVAATSDKSKLVATVDKSKPVANQQSTVLKVVKKQTTEPETVIKITKTATKKAPETPSIEKVGQSKSTDKKLQVIELVNQMLDFATTDENVKTKSGSEAKQLKPRDDARQSISKSPTVPPGEQFVDTKSLDELIIVNGFHKSSSKEPSPALSHHSETTKISSGHLVDHATGNKISLKIINSNKDGTPATDSENAIQKNKDEQQEEPLKLLTAVFHEPYTTAPIKRIESHQVYSSHNEQLKQSDSFKIASKPQQQIAAPQTSATKLVAQLKLLEEKEKLVENARFYDSFQDYKRQVSQPRTDPSVYELHRLPSVDREMLQLLTLGDELYASRSSMHTAESQTPNNSTRQSPQWSEPMSNKQHMTSTGIAADNISWRGSRESLNSNTKLNNAPKPWRSALPQTQEREGSIDSMSSFATAASHPMDSKEIAPAKVEGFNRKGSFEVIRVDMKGQNVQSTKGPGVQQQHAITKNVNNSSMQAPSGSQPKVNGVAHTSSKSPSRYRPVNSLDQASKKIDQMLNQAKVKQNTEQFEKSPFKNFTNELDEVYEEIKREYANEQQMRKNIRDAATNEELKKKNARTQQWQQDALMNKAAVLSPNLVENVYMSNLKNNKYISQSNTQISTTASVPSKLNDEFTEYDRVKMDYTKRWLEGDLKSLTRDPKPDLLQFDSPQAQLDADQRSIGSASAEVAAITNREKLHALRVPDLVPKKYDIVKPSAVVSKAQMVSYQQSEIKYTGNTGKHMIAQNYAMSEPCPYPYLSNKQALVGHVRANDGLFQLEKNPPLPKREIGMVKKQVNMFDRMSDNESERSFLSDNIAYKSTLNRLSSSGGRKTSLTDHIAGFIRKFESDEALMVGTKSSLQQCNSNKPHLVAEKDFVRVPPRRIQHYSGGSTHSLPIIQPPVQMFRNYPASTCQDNHIPGQWQKASVPWTNKFNHGNQGQYLTVPTFHDDLLPWSSNSTLADLDNSDAYFADLSPSASAALPAKPAYLNKNYFQNLDSIVAELTLHTDERQPTNYHRFPTESKFSPGRQLASGSAAVVLDAEQPVGNFPRRQMLNVIPEYNEHYENIQYAQRKLEQARHELKQTSANFMSTTQAPVAHSNGFNHDFQQQDSNMHPQDYAINQKRRSYIEPNGDSNNVVQNRNAVPYSNEPRYQNYDTPPELPPRNQPSTNYGAVRQPPRNPPASRAIKQAQRASWHEPSFTERMSQQQKEDDYDNIAHLRLLNAQIEQQAALHVPRLHSPKTIKIGSIVLNKQAQNLPEQQRPPNIEVQPIMRSKLDQNGDAQQSKNPIKTLFQMFNKTPKNAENNKVRQPVPSTSSVDDPVGRNINALKGSSVSLNINVMQSTRLPPVMHKSNSTNEATKFRTYNNNNNSRSGNGRVELQQLDDLILAMQSQQQWVKDQQMNSSMIQDQTSKDQDKQKKFKLGWSLWKR